MLFGCVCICNCRRQEFILRCRKKAVAANFFVAIVQVNIGNIAFTCMHTVSNVRSKAASGLVISTQNNLGLNLVITRYTNNFVPYSLEKLFTVRRNLPFLRMKSAEHMKNLLIDGE
jgi:hypothetical protein